MRKASGVYWDGRERREVVGFFHRWAAQMIEGREDFGNYTVALIEEEGTGKIRECSPASVTLFEEQEVTRDWYCGCGHWNGCNLSVCAVCGRTPGGI